MGSNFSSFFADFAVILGNAVFGVVFFRGSSSSSSESSNQSRLDRVCKIRYV